MVIKFNYDNLIQIDIRDCHFSRQSPAWTHV